MCTRVSTSNSQWHWIAFQRRANFAHHLLSNSMPFHTFYREKHDDMTTMRCHAKKRAKSPPSHQNVKLQQIWFLQWQDLHCLNFAENPENKQSPWIFESKLFNFFLLWITSKCRFLEIFREHTTWIFWFELFLFPFF